ncbi:zinc finger BED domain-containing protein 4-like [Hemicordylus capensis]|uniref:zinc finger BED domain-containing protein 4-like n=1 Tax=Hemicordylus capensis TaxID=884348 RepID=UPI0023031594|nr:zinc finger BED domain-containing protein 4-like [Hemicordylus capensis]XP_053103898.1 zinc finger BED domain-containing protein 4-like [Hemicordylus capensis]
MRSLGDRPEEAPNTEVEDLVPRSPWERTPQALAAYERQESHTVPSSSEVKPEARESAIPQVQPEGSESSIPELNVSAVPSVLPEEEEAFCSVSPTDAIPGPPMHPRTTSLPASSATSHHGSDGAPLLSSTSTSASNAAFLGHQSGQALPPVENAASNERTLEHIGRAIKQDLRKSLCPMVHFTIDYWETGPTTGYLVFVAHWVVNNGLLLWRRQAVMIMYEAEPSNLTGIILDNLKRLRDKWFHPMQLQVGYVVTPTMAVPQAVGDCCLGWVFSPVDCLGQLIKGVMEKVRNEDFLILWVWQVLCKVSIHFEQSPVAHERLRELQLLYHLPQELLHEKMPTASNNLFLLLEFLLARRKAFSALEPEIPGLFFTRRDWCLMRHLACLLKPFEETITTIQKEDANLGQVLPELQLLEDKVKGCFPLLLQESNFTVSVAATRFATELLKSLENHSKLGLDRENLLYQTATLLHPCFRDHIHKYLKGDIEKKKWQLKVWVTQQIEKEYLNLSSAYVTPSLTEIVSKELESYLQDNIDPVFLQMDPLVYWITKKYIWPSLSTVAFRCFSCPPSPLILREGLGIEDLMIAGRCEVRVALKRLNRNWIAAGSGVSNTSTETGSQSMA